MKKLLLPVAFATIATSVSAMDLGYGVSVGAETELTYTTGTELWTLDVTPSMGIGAYGVSFTGETTIDVLDLNNGDIFTGVDWKAEYVWNGMTTYTKVSSDADLDFLYEHEWESAIEKEYAMMFIQSLSKVDDASLKLEKLGYYNVYPSEEYQTLVLDRRKRRTRQWQ